MAAEYIGGQSAWIKKLVEPSTVDESFKDGYIDMLANRTKPFSDLSWVLKGVHTPEYKYKRHRGYEQLNKDVLNSDRVRNAVEKISKETKRSSADVMKDAESIIAEMAHCFNMKSVRTLGYGLIKVFKAINDHVYVNADGLIMLNQLIQEYPVLLVPSHRSYIDFLILSILCFNYDLPLPAIVAAQDFMGMAVVGSMLRNSGAFYIRRAFRADELYWAIFTEYVQTQLCNGDHPIEFFVEGTRSRTQKSYTPKLGALDACLEAYFKGMVPDVMIVPISISYDRVLEENLFAQELLGIPKPKEATSKLFKALGVLKENYGSIHVTITPPLSVRSMSVGKIHRPIHSVEPRFQVSITEEEEKLVEEIGLQIVWQQQKNMVLSVWCLVASVLLQRQSGVNIAELTETVLWLKRHANNVGAYIDWPAGCSDEEVIKSCLLSHKSYVELIDDRVSIIRNDHSARLHKAGSMDAETMGDAATRMVLAIYRNQLVHVFVPYSLLAMIVMAAPQSRRALPIDEARSSFTFGCRLFEKEFVLDQKSIPKQFDDAVQMLTHTNDLMLNENGTEIILSRSSSRFIEFLSNMLLPFATGYWMLCQYVRLTSVDIGVGKEPVVRPKELVKAVQRFAFAVVCEGHVSDYEILNLDMLHNCVHSLKSLGAVYYEKRNGEKFVASRMSDVTSVVSRLESLAPVPSIILPTLRALAVPTSLKPKL